MEDEVIYKVMLDGEEEPIAEGFETYADADAFISRQPESAQRYLYVAWTEC